MSREYDQIKGLIKNAEECLSVAYKRGYKDGKNSVDPKTKMADFIEIPEGATNGFMLTALFGEEALVFLTTHNYLKDWWNSSYRKEQRDEH